MRISPANAFQTIIGLRHRSRAWAILASILSVGALTLGVKLVAFLKEVVAARKFGTSDQMDAFLIAWLVPSLVPQVLAQGVPEALLPAWAELREREGRQAADRLAISAVQMNGIVLGLVMAVLWVEASWLEPLLAPGFSEAKQNLTISLMQELTPFGFLFGLSFALSAWLNANKKFLVAALAPALIPLCILITLLLPGGDSVHALVRGANAGSVLLLAILLLACCRDSGMKLRDFFRVNFDHHAKRLFRDSTPLLMGGVLMCCMPLVDKVMAGMLPNSGNVAVLEFSEKVCAIILTLAAGSAAQVLYPWVAERASQRDWTGMRRMLLRAVKTIGLASLSVVVIFWIVSPQIVRVLFEGGAFHAEDTIRVAAVLQFSAIQIPFYIAAVIASKTVNSLRAGRFMLFTTVVNLAANIGLNLLFSRWMGVAGLALATACVYALSAFMLISWSLREMRRRTLADSLSPS